MIKITRWDASLMRSASVPVPPKNADAKSVSNFVTHNKVTKKANISNINLTIIIF